MPIFHPAAEQRNRSGDPHKRSPYNHVTMPPISSTCHPTRPNEINSTTETRLPPTQELDLRTGLRPLPEPKSKPRPTPQPEPTSQVNEDKNSNDKFFEFAHDLPFTMTFKTINYPAWATDSARPLHYLPIPLADLPDIPAIPTKLDVPFTQIMSSDVFGDTIDGILHGRGYQLSQHDVWKVYVSYTLKEGKRLRLAIKVDNVELLTGYWARDVYLGQTDAVAGNCACEECKTGRPGRYGHGLEVEVVFPQGSESRRRKPSDQKSQVGYVGGKEELPSHVRDTKAFTDGTSARTVRKVHFADGL